MKPFLVFLLLLPLTTVALGTRGLATRLYGGHQAIPTQELVAPDDDMQSKQQDNKLVKASLLRNVMFTSLPSTSLKMLVEAFERIEAKGGEVIVQQGGVGDYVYVVAEGECTVTVDGEIVPEPYGVLRPQSIFGELAVLYNSTRAASVIAKTDKVALFRIDGDTFKSVLNTVQNTNDKLELEKIDEAIMQIAGTKSLFGGDIIKSYKSSRWWLWTRWSGTVLQHNLWPTFLNMLFSTVTIMILRRLTDPMWPIGMAPDPSHPLIIKLAIFQKIWLYQMTLTTFILTFFVNKAYDFWKDVYNIARCIQGRLNDFHLLLATSAARNDDGTYTPESESLLDDVAVSSRLLHAFFWGSCARRFEVLITPRGMERMASRGLMTSKQLQVLQSLNVPNNQKHGACLEWMMVRAFRGLDDGTLKDRGLSKLLMGKMCELRSTYASIDDKLSGRMVCLMLSIRLACRIT